MRPPGCVDLARRELEAIREDAGRTMGFVRVVAERTEVVGEAAVLMPPNGTKEGGSTMRYVFPLALALCVYLAPTRVQANGSYSHIHISQLAVEKLPNT